MNTLRLAAVADGGRPGYLRWAAACGHDVRLVTAAFNDLPAEETQNWGDRIPREIRPKAGIPRRAGRHAGFRAGRAAFLPEVDPQLAAGCDPCALRRPGRCAGTGIENPERRSVYHHRPSGGRARRRTGKNRQMVPDHLPLHPAHLARSKGRGSCEQFHGASG